VHTYTAEDERVSRELADFCLSRLAMQAPLDRPRTPTELQHEAGQTVTSNGIGADEALRLWRDVLGPACLSVDHQRYLSFIPSAPTKAAAGFDMLVGATSVYSGSWLEGAGAVFAENQALRWLADLAGLPPESGGAFVQGGTIGNLSALVAAREAARHARGGRPARWAVCITEETHSSVKHALRVVMDVDVVNVPGDERGRLTCDRPSTHCLRRIGTPSSPWSPRPERRTSASSTTSQAWPTSHRLTAGGCTSTARTAARRWPRRASGGCSTGSSTPTRSSSTRTSGFSRRSTHARSSTATLRRHARRTPSARAIWTR
jgi:hypothetical protein